MSFAQNIEATSVLPTVEVRRLTVAQYEAMGNAGILTADDRVELLDGLLVEKMTKNPPHRITTKRARGALERATPSGWYVDSQEPIVTADSEPEPDVVVVRGRTEDYATKNPPATSVALVVEVADTTLARDRELKGAIYARAAIPTYWIVNLIDHVVEAYTRPSGTGDGAHYAQRRNHAVGEVLVVEIEGGMQMSIAVDDVLP